MVLFKPHLASEPVTIKELKEPKAASVILVCLMNSLRKVLGLQHHGRRAVEVMVSFAWYPEVSNFLSNGVRRFLLQEPRKLLFSYEIALSCSRLPHHLPLCLYLHLSYISYCCAESVHTLPYSSKIFCRLWRLRIPSRHDQKGGDGMSISAFSVTLAAWSSSWVKSDAGGLIKTGEGGWCFSLPRCW